MAKVITNVVVQGVSGSIGRLVFRQMPGGETYVSSSPDFSRRKFSDKQLAHQSRFSRAAAYARDASERFPIYAKLAKGTALSPYNVALSDWWRAPVIHAVERLDEAIRVRASDNVMVARVEVAILGEDGSVLMKGDAVQTGNDVWTFATTLVGRVVVKVWDLPGNVTEGGC